MKHGFTLLELTIVLAIIGLIIGGITVGAGLVRSSEVGKVVTDLKKYEFSVKAFQLKYDALPGDMTDATSYWGAANANPTACVTTASGTKTTCNGNGDGLIQAGPESYRAWQHLANAGIFSNSYNGVPTAGHTGADGDVVGVNIPETIDKNGINLTSFWSSFFMAGGGSFNTLTIAVCCHPGNQRLEGPALIPTEAYNIDLKIDDGQPDAGDLSVYAGYGGCITSGTVGPAEYNFAVTGKACHSIYKLK